MYQNQVTKESSMRSKFFIILAVLLMAVTLTACAGVAAAQSDSSQTPIRTINVNGTGKVYVTPDIAYVTIGVHTEGKDAAETLASNSSTTEKVVAAIKAQGVDEKDIQTTNISIYPQQQYDPQGKPTGEITYMVDNSVYVTVRDLDKLGDVMDSAVKAGANTISGVQYSLADRTEATSAARKLAVEDAQAQAKELAEYAGVTLGPVQTISTLGLAAPVPVYEGKGGGGAVAMDTAGVPVSTGQMVIQVDVSIVYQIQ
jgi:hypothetical protein